MNSGTLGCCCFEGWRLVDVGCVELGVLGQRRLLAVTHNHVHSFTGLDRSRLRRSHVRHA
jgi:hypothetical protein